ncbi:hypothetical protein [uncultured Massilia sp.]|uniref:hypothetical protein n=1 Tax=uncultured Massilia sp. TaxID=169973 RepID=UPI0025F5F66F|nr:hypothetical protein [uncultured Massilia sp.]
MAQLSLVLPFALPAPEFAPDLARALQAPALAALLSKSSGRARHALDGAARALPHELWIARALGLAHGPHALAPGVAARAMRGYGLDPGDGTWFVVNPAHIQIARSHLQMGDVRQLDLREDEGRALFDAALPCFEEAGHALRYGDAATWFMRADGWDEIRTSSPDAAVGMNLTDWMPSGPPARAFRKLQNEVQVTWYTHPANAAREARGQAPVNAVWPWGEASIATEHATRLIANAGARTLQVPRLATWSVPGWLGALAERRLDGLDGALDAVSGLGNDVLLACGNVAAPAIAADWDGWLREMQRLDTALFAPLLAAVRAGRVNRLRLVLTHRDGHLETTTTPMAQRQFWRRPTLESLT